MEMTKYWEVSTKYDGKAMNHWESQSHFRTIALSLGVKMKWMFGQTTPKDWLGYTPDNPSPGYRIDYHSWAIEDEEQAMMFYLSCGCQITCKEMKHG